MVSAASVEQQLKQLGFKHHGWGQAEVKELQHILVSGEQIYECVNGIYEGGFALLVATDVRVLLIDKKPLNYLTVEDLRFDMINEIDYSHRLTGARINIATGSKNLKFHSYNQPRLRKLITHIQHCMAEAKKQQSSHQEGQNQHLEQINRQLQAYLVAQYQYQQQMQGIQLANRAGVEVPPTPESVRPDPELSDYLLARSLMAQHQASTEPLPLAGQPQLAATSATADAQNDEIYNDALREVFAKQLTPGLSKPKPFEITVNPLRVAYAKLPLILHGRKFGQLSFATH